MNNELFTDKNFIEQFRTEIELNIFDNIKETTATTTAFLADFSKYFIQPDTTKIERRLIQINPFKSYKKNKSNALLPHTIIVDIDFKEQEQINLFLKDTQSSTLAEGLERTLNNFKNDSACLIAAYSSSGKGIKAIYNVISDYYFNHYTSFDADNSTLVDMLMIKNYEVVKEHLKKINLYSHLDSDGNEVGYLDPSATNVTQGIFSSNSIYHFNYYAHILKYRIDGVAFDSELNYKSKTSLSVEQTASLNNLYASDFLKYLFQKNKEAHVDEESKKEWLKILDILSSKMAHLQPSLSLRFSLKYLDDEYRQHFYNFFCKLYVGKKRHMFLSNYEQFVKHLHTLNATYITPLSSLFGDIYSVNPLRNSSYNSDFFNNKYDLMLSYDEYISEHQTTLFDAFDSNERTVLKAEPGAGKSTLLQDYFIKSLATDLKRVVFVIPKNSLLDQQHHIIESKLEAFNKGRGDKIRLVKNYGIGNRYIKDDYSSDERLLILSSTPKLKYVSDAELVCVDEIQNLVFYSNEILSNIPDVKLILTSATPEPYLIAKSSYYYINLNKNNKKKKKLTKIISKHHTTTLKGLIDGDRKQLIFYNNFDASKNIAETFKDVDFHYLNSQVKNEKDVKDVVIDQELNHTHYISTSFISDGINFNNIEWNDLIIIENSTLSPFEIEQLSNRFRKIKNLNIYLLSKSRTDSFLKNVDFTNFHDDTYYQQRLKELRKKEALLNANFIDGKEYVNSNYFIKLENTGKYVLNTDAIKLEIYNNTYHQLYMNKIDICDASLNYYFDTEQVFILKGNDDKLDSSKILADIFIQHYKEIINHLTNTPHLQFIGEFGDVDINNDTLSVIKFNQSFYTKLVGRCNEMKMLDIDIDDNLHNVVQNDNVFARFLARQKKLKLDESNGKQLDTLSKLAYERQNKMIDIISNNIEIHDGYTRATKRNPIQQHYRYILIDDVISHFENNDKDYKYFENEDGKKEFEKNNKSLGIYLSFIKRFISGKKSKRINGSPRKIYLLK
ncbi:DEAD/DEAH box helicase [Carboxylicivirga sp. RSCT41]|uniref:DEAD/DEAH box helicase n=1 Tax=Carboxylicivirga agarovorans TaxID=3417570 RepID=UPI003D344759